MGNVRTVDIGELDGWGGRRHIHIPGSRVAHHLYAQHALAD